MGIDVEYEVHGGLADPVGFPILGITDNITDWPTGLYEPLLEQGFCVAQHEPQDSGYSSKSDDTGTPDLATAQAMLDNNVLPPADYTMHDVADDTQRRCCAEHIDVVGFYCRTVAMCIGIPQSLPVSPPYSGLRLATARPPIV
jgi:hypothetical protein